MTRKNKTTISKRLRSILHSNEGTSLVLVTIIAIIIITGVVILRVTTSTLWASADKQYYQDRCYVMATSMGDSIDKLIHDGTINLAEYTSETKLIQSGQINASSGSGDSTEVVITPSGEGYVVTVTATAGNASYSYSAFYSKTGSGGSYSRQIL